MADDTIEVLDEEEIGQEDLETLVMNKDKGFRRTNPTVSSDTSPLYSKVISSDAGRASDALKQNPGGQNEQQQHSVPQQKQSQNEQVEKVRYCHYFNNSRCNFETKSGRK